MIVVGSEHHDWVGYVIAVIGLVVSIGLVLYQLGKQHKSSLQLQRSNAREALKLKVYEVLNKKVREFSRASSEARSYAESIPRELESQITSFNIGLKRSTITLRADQLSKVHYHASSLLTTLIIEIESWEIAFPASKLFRVALISANRDIEDAFHPLFSDSLCVLPTDLGDKGIHVPQPPTPEQLEKLKAECSAYTDARTTLITYTHDLVVEAQNILLAELFDRRVEIRRPIDPIYKVITASNTEALMKYFHTETASGKSWQEAKQKARDAFGQRTQEPNE
jgi:hypothetical protein